jgi:hypothetical protein
LRVEYRPLENLIPYAHNARTHSDAQVAQIAASIKEFGWTNPVLVDGDNGVIAGHGRLLASRKLGIVDVPVIELAGLSEAAKRAYILADNKLALNAGCDEAMLGLEIGDLSQLGVDLTLAGFSDRELQALAAGQHTGLTDPDETPESPTEPIAALGDVWILGRHRLICGDCTDPAIVEKLLGDVEPHLMMTDPPYGVSYDPQWRNRVRGADGTRVGALAIGEVLNDDQADWRQAWALFPGDVAYVWHAALHTSAVSSSLEAAGFAIRAQIIWDKMRLVIGRGDYLAARTPLVCSQERQTGHWAGDRKQTTVWGISSKVPNGPRHAEAGRMHEATDDNNSSPGQAVYEPFSGSGTTIIAAEMTGRACYAVELAPTYVDVAVQCWQAFTGDQVRLASTDQLFEHVSRHRQSRPVQEATV